MVGVNHGPGASGVPSLALAAADALPLVERLAAGDDVDSIGINGRAVGDPDQEVGGVWVAGVRSGSPAEQAGIEAGDIVTRLDGEELTSDPTMGTYCDVLRERGVDATMDVEVIRSTTGEVLRGQVNGDPLG